jgi:hypothetical protein
MDMTQPTPTHRKRQQLLLVFRSTLHFVYVGYKYNQHHASTKYSTASSASLLFIEMNRTDAFFY